jgi:S1-C subfamily serine protease
MALLTDFARTVTLSLANADTVPAFDPETAKIQGRGGYNGARVSFGIVPDFAENAAGFRISGVSRGSTAESIGLQPGDIITKVGSRPVKNIQDYMAALETFAPGDKTVIQWTRQSQPMQAEATLRARN